MRLPGVWEGERHREPFLGYWMGPDDYVLHQGLLVVRTMVHVGTRWIYQGNRMGVWRRETGVAAYSGAALGGQHRGQARSISLVLVTFWLEIFLCVLLVDWRRAAGAIVNGRQEPISSCIRQLLAFAGAGGGGLCCRPCSNGWLS